MPWEDTFWTRIFTGGYPLLALYLSQLRFVRLLAKTGFQKIVIGP